MRLCVSIHAQPPRSAIKGNMTAPAAPIAHLACFQMRRSARAAFATDQAAKKPARTMSASFQASLDLGLRRGNIGGMALRARMTATTMPIADATTAGSGAVKGNMTVRTSDRVITAPHRHNPSRQETKRSTKFAWPKREGYFVSRVPKNRDISMQTLRHSTSSTRRHNKAR